MLFKDHDTIDAVLRARGIGALVPSLVADTRPTLALAQGSAGDSSAFWSKTGGDPDLPASVDWPTLGGGEHKPWDIAKTPIPFYAQLDFGELGADFLAPLWPKTGKLWVFYTPDLTSGLGDYSGDPSHGLRLIFEKTPPAAMERRPSPPDCYRGPYQPLLDYDQERRIESAWPLWRLPELERNGSRRETAQEVPPLPPGFEARHALFLNGWPNDLYFEPEELDAWIEAACDAVSDMDYDLVDRLDGGFRLGGWPDQVQGAEEQTITNLEARRNARLNVSEYYGNEGLKFWGKARAEAYDHSWRLLMQFPTADGCAMIYVWIQEEDLAATRFDRCWAHYVGT